MEALFYQTQDLDLSSIAQALVLEYQAKGFEAQQFGDVNNVTVQLRHESTLRTITGFNKALAVSMQRIQNGTFVRVGAQDWVDQIAVGAVGLVIHPLLITAAIGALTQYNALHDVLRSIDYQVHRQQPQVQVSMPPSNLWMPPTFLGRRLQTRNEENESTYSSIILHSVCQSERSEKSRAVGNEILHFAQNDKPLV